MKRFLQLFALALALAVLAGCGKNTRRVSPPSVSIQQLAVQANGNWVVDVRVHNFSSVSMQFHTLELAVSVDEHAAGTLRAAPGMSIGPTSADVVKATFKPDGMARIAVADALAGRRSLAYRLEGKVSATPDEARKPREFEIDYRSSVNPAPGLDGVLR
ncbi:hypothetical protein B1992_01720 [Pseudoxanthomonas broegbernensis]|uniref:Late embryogenesis abundant protein LEA-2 subgroup domain-containing protein n=1 Tax=Pseudoxanthomonas broegbernensis TaxID=83619 RepID=A0A7V8K8A7_9GAMM|nr:LEA type 2 family protein [Pseudoxanthomonas broegbernensis]KAF1688159.1 hypothetical protein B1992_01720 [Pseudoxanthomonas broegbernensis]MBB6065209.1 LEA14-like dessication related protein [Pseudoxanthomonas broegbernensis]